MRHRAIPPAIPAAFPAAFSAALRDWRVSWPLVVLAIAYLVTLAVGRAVIGDPDVYWHIVAGRWIIAHGAVPHADLFSHTMSGAPWVAHEWLAETVMAAIYDGLGWHGLAAMTGLCGGLALALFARAMLRSFEPVHALMAVAGAWLLLMPHWLARPHIIALPLLVLWMASLVAARDAGRAPPFALALLMIPWVNLHGGFLVGLGFAGLLMIEAAIEAPGAAARRDAVLRWGGFIALAVAATLVTPNGIEAYLLPLRLLDMKFALSVLTEWRSPDFQELRPLELWLLLAFCLVLVNGIRLKPMRALMVLLLVHLALKHGRHSELLGFIAPLLAAAPVAAQLARAVASGAVASGAAASGAGAGTASRLDRWAGALARPAGAGGVALAIVVLAAASVASAAYPLAPDAGNRPRAALAAVAASHIAGKVMNDYAFGGYLIFAGIPTFIDGRADMYGDPFIERYFEATNGERGDLPKLLDDYGVAWTLFPPASPAVILLDLMPGWRRLYADDIAVVHVRRENASGG